jgi:HEPN domain-containing protein
MTPQLEEAQRLLRLAERDRETFEILANSDKRSHAAAGFHAQQAVEKALKALLCLRDLDFPRTHDLETLLALLSNSGTTPPVALAEVRPLTPYAVDFRYDDEIAALLNTAEMRSITERALAFAACEIAGE